MTPEETLRQYQTRMRERQREERTRYQQALRYQAEFRLGGIPNGYTTIPRPNSETNDSNLKVLSYILPEPSSKAFEPFVLMSDRDSFVCAEGGFCIAAVKRSSREYITATDPNYEQTVWLIVICEKCSRQLARGRDREKMEEFIHEYNTARDDFIGREHVDDTPSRRFM